jgi:outer membrane protein
MLKKILLLFICLFTAVLWAGAQDSLSITQCISYALANNTQLHRAQNDLQQASNSYNQSRANVLPTLNGSATNNYNFGRTIDPATNQFANQTSRTNYFNQGRYQPYGSQLLFTDTAADGKKGAIAKTGEKLRTKPAKNQHPV